jgi:hypothetical protein
LDFGYTRLKLPWPDQKADGVAASEQLESLGLGSLSPKLDENQHARNKRPCLDVVGERRRFSGAAEY